MVEAPGPHLASSARVERFHLAPLVILLRRGTPAPIRHALLELGAHAFVNRTLLDDRCVQETGSAAVGGVRPFLQSRRSWTDIDSLFSRRDARCHASRRLFDIAPRHATELLRSDELPIGTIDGKEVPVLVEVGEQLSAILI